MIKALKEWEHCTACPLHEFRKRTVIGSGQMPADLLIVGDGPQRAEDMTGAAYCGPGGRTLDQALYAAFHMIDPDDACAIPDIYKTYLIGCRACDAKGGPGRAPSPAESMACWPRIEQIYALVRPQKIAFLGKEVQAVCKHAFPEGRLFIKPELIRPGDPGWTRYCRDWAEFLKGLF